MNELYKRIETLCLDHRMNISEMCKNTGASRGSLTDLKMGRTASLTAETLSKIAAYFDVSVDFLLGKEQKETLTKAPPSNDDLKLALFGGDGEVTDEMWEEAKFAAELIKERHKRKKDNID